MISLDLSQIALNIKFRRSISYAGLVTGLVVHTTIPFAKKLFRIILNNS
jgi:hypothetical protein